MATNSNKEAWIEEVISSTTGMARAEAPAGFYERVLSGINQPKTVKVVSLPLKQWAAAAVLLVVVNIVSIVYFSAQNRRQGATTNPIAAQMEQGATYNY